MRLPNSEHFSRPWRIHELTADFRLEDVWVLPTPGRPDDFQRLVQVMATFDPSKSPSGAVSTLVAIHLGWVPDQTGGYRGQMAVLVKRNGSSGPVTWPRSGRSAT